MQGLVYDVQRYYRVVAPFISAELANRGDEKFWAEVGRRYRRGTILELGCGSGRVTELLAAAGAHVVGIDLSPELLQLAKCQLRLSRVALALTDIRHVALRGAFDVVVAAVDPFSHLTADRDRDRALTEVSRLLVPGGRFFLDALWFGSQEAHQHAKTRDVELDGRVVHITEHWTCDSRTHRCDAEYDYDVESGTSAHAAFRARYWTTDELERRFESAGLRIVGRWGYNHERWQESASGQLLVEAARR